MLQWYVVQTKPKQERVAIENLERQGYTTYCPMMALRRRRRGQWREVTEPLFPRYLFVQLDVGSDDFSPIRSTLGVTGMLRFGAAPATVPDNVIDSIKQQEAEAKKHFSSDAQWKAGDEVTIIDGPFAGLQGIFQKKSNEERVIILLDLLGKQNRLQVNAYHIAPS